MSARAAVSVLLIAVGAGLLWLAGQSRQGRGAAPPAGWQDPEPAEPSQPLLAGPPAADRLIRIPDRPALARADAPAPPAEPSGFIDLTNLIDAAKGDPVLFSYFGVVREQIQYMAGAREWLSGPAETGLVYVSFVLNEDGSLRGASVVTERSVESGRLRAAAVQIVLNAGPFPPVPPSMPGGPATLVVPLEFLAAP